jgi:hypothetical protein
LLDRFDDRHPARAGPGDIQPPESNVWPSLNHDPVGRWNTNGEHSDMIAVREGGGTRAS